MLQIAAQAGFECEAYGETVERFGVDVHRDAVESVDRSIDAGVGARVALGGRAGFAWTNDLGPGGLRAMVAAAGENARACEPGEVDVLADCAAAPSAPAARRPYPREFPAGAKTDGALAMERAARAFGNGIVNTESAGYSEFTAEVHVAGTRGFRRSERRGMCACSIGAVAARGDDVGTGWFYAQALEPGAIDFVRVGEEAARRAVNLLGAGPLTTGRYPVVFDGMAFAEIAGLLAETLSGEMAERGMSVFARSAGLPVASPLFELVDDPFLEGGCFNSTFDDEGVPRRRRALIEAGVCRGFLHTSRSARKAGPAASAGSAVRGSYRYPPSPGPTNLIVVPAPPGGENPIGALEDGIYILDVMGVHTADPISGDFSFGIRGLRMRGGRPDGAVSEMTISGGVQALLEGIRMLGTELKFAGHCAAPDVLVEGLSLGGR